jgi:hypothetical protein
VTNSSSKDLPLALQVQPPSTQTRCLVGSCRSSRIRVDCGRRFCKTHCLAAGGCASRAHRVSATSASQFLPSRAPDPPSLRLPVPPPPPPQLIGLGLPSASFMPSTLSMTSALPSASESTLSVTSTLPSASTLPTPFTQSMPSTSSIQSSAPPSVSLSLDARPNSRYVSHMPPIFTEQWETEQILRERQRKTDASRLENINKSKHTVVVYAWTETDVEPTIIEYQDKFIWPHFILTRSVLNDLDFRSDSTTVLLHRPSLGTWTRVREGHVILVDTQNRIFLRDVGVKQALNFDQLIKEQKPLHFRSNLPHERSSVRRDTTRKKAALRWMDVSSASEDASEVTSSAKTRVKRKLKQGSTSVTTHTSQVTSEQSDPPSPVRLQKRLRIHPNQPADPREVAETAAQKRLRIHKRLHIHPSQPADSREVIEVSSGSSGSDIEGTDLPPLPSRVLLLPQIKTEPLSPRGSPAMSSSGSVKKIVWPRDFYVADIVDCFIACENVDGSRVGHIFTAHFNTTFRRSTYYENKDRWQSAPQSVKDIAIEAGHSTEGLWSTFLTKVPSRRKKRVAAAAVVEELY